MKTGVLLVNTGSPDSPDARDVKKYLQEFLMDERVIDIPEWKRRLLVYGIIAPFRAKKVSTLYKNIWTPRGSPLVAITRSLAKKIAVSTRLPVECAMRYGNPSIKSALDTLTAKRVKKIILVPMFPHYAMSTYESVVEKVKSEVKNFSEMNLEVIKPYYNDPDFIKSLYDNSRDFLKKNYDHLIFSYHSLPIRHIQKADKTKNTCLVRDDCCEVSSPAHETCYKAQILQTTKLFMKKARIDSKKTSLTFQSAMRGAPWLMPSTEEKIRELAQKGYKDVLIICPGFVTDNLETLDEIAIRGAKSFLSNAASGTDSGDTSTERSRKPGIDPKFTFIPSLNLHETWVKTLTKWIKDAT
jgi:ferrochelatase